ncbi:hypothetical protein C8Q73DRAFT_493767 [Cubamyces lactineus]|nr:hypothetical protein C8Q73DRAFT_493767 [Cubamyces lactineus]
MCVNSRLYAFIDKANFAMYQDEASSECSDGTVDIADHIQPQSRLPSNPLGSKTLMEAARDELLVATIAESALPAMGRVQCEERPKIWNKPGLSPLRQELAVDNEEERASHLLLVTRCRRVIETKRDRVVVDRICARKLVLRAQACLHYDQLPEDVRLVSGCSEIARREMAQMLDESNVEPMPYSTKGKGTPPGPRDPCCERPTLVPPKSDYWYTVASGAFMGEGINKEAFHGPGRWAMLVPDLKGKGKAIAQTEGEKPACLALRIRVLEANDDYEIHTDVRAMSLWKEHSHACQVLDVRGWAGRTTFAIVQAWEFDRVATEAIQAELVEEALASSSSTVSLPPAPSPTPAAEPDIDVDSNASGETCVLTDNDEEDFMDWIDPALFEGE